MSKYRTELSCRYDALRFQWPVTRHLGLLENIDQQTQNCENKFEYF